MPSDSLLVVSVVTAAFVFFAVVVAYVDMTWDKGQRQPGERIG